MSKVLGLMSLEEINARSGDTVMTHELGGDVLIAKLIRANDTFKNEKPSSITVDHGDGKNVVWPTQWHQAVFA